MPATSNPSLRRTLFLSALGAAILLGASPVEAAIVDITVVGTVASGIDTSGDFGTIGADLAGVSYTANFKFDTTVGGVTASPTLNSAQGGSSIGSASPSLGASITILGNTINVGGSYFGFILQSNTGLFSHSYADERDANVTLFSGIYGYPGTSPASDTDAFSVTSAGQSSNGQFTVDSGTQLNLSPLSYTLTLGDVIPVPEPASMALLGLAVAGAGAVRRKRA